MPLLRHYAAYFADALKADVRGLTAHAETMARTHRWPGNVRELRNRVERGVALANGPWLDPADLFPDLMPREFLPDMLPSLAHVVDAAQRRHIQAIFERSGGRLKKAAELLGISRTTLWEKMRRLGLAADNVDEDVQES